MKKAFVVLFVVLTTHVGMAQIHELGLFAGGSNFIGDVGSTSYIKPNQLALGVLYKWNRSPRYAWRASYTYADIQGVDRDSDDRRRQARGFSFSNRISEFSLGMEFNFLEFNLHNERRVVTPYIYGGVSYFSYRVVNSSLATETEWDFSIPMTLGVKASIAKHLVLGAEIGARYTLTDNLEGNNTGIVTFGNTNSDDWYVFTGATLTYTFGRRPCYCRDY